MTVTQDFYAALDSEAQLESLRRYADRELRAGTPRQQLLAEFEELRTELRSAGRDQDDDVVLDVMDFVAGWCSPHARM